MLSEAKDLGVGAKSRKRSDSGNGRMYDQLIGQFLSPDNFIQDPFNSQNLNRYAYCVNNPLKYSDFSGNNITRIPPENWEKLLTQASAGFPVDVLASLYGEYSYSEQAYLEFLTKNYAIH